jgi:hypothetical protein
MACQEPLRPDEQAAKRLVQLCLPEVEVCLHDDDTEDMMYDLELRWPDGHAEAMEVTTDTDPERRRLYDAIDRHGIRFDVTLCCGFVICPCVHAQTTMADEHAVAAG